PVITRISDYVSTTFILFIFTPLTSLYGLTDWPLEPVIVTFLSFVIFIFIAQSKWMKVPALPDIKEGERYALFIASAAVIGLIVWYVISGANFNLDMTRIYEFRRDNAELASFGVLAYLNNWTYKIFSLFLIAYFLNKKRYFLF